VTRPRISDLLNGRIDLLSTDALIDMLARLGVGVRLVVKPVVLNINPAVLLSAQRAAAHPRPPIKLGTEERGNRRIGTRSV
jgi:hypothetical protein